MKAKGVNVNYQYPTAGKYRVVLSAKGTVKVFSEEKQKYVDSEKIEEVKKEIVVR